MYDDDYGPSSRMVERRCARCGRTFRMAVDGEYVMHVVCNRCLSMQDAMQRVRQIEADIFVKR